MSKRQECQSVSDTKCSVSYTPNCRQVPKQECATVQETKNEMQCSAGGEQKCDTVNEKVCSIENEQQCNTVNDK